MALELIEIFSARVHAGWRCVRAVCLFAAISLLWSCGGSNKPGATVAQPVQSPHFAIVGYWQSTCLPQGNGSVREYFAISQERMILTTLTYSANANCTAPAQIRDRAYIDYAMNGEAANDVKPAIYPLLLEYLDYRRTYLEAVEPNFKGFGYSDWESGVEKSIAGRSADNSGAGFAPTKGEKVYQIISFIASDRFALGRIDPAQRPNKEADQPKELELNLPYVVDLLDGANADLPLSLQGKFNSQ